MPEVVQTVTATQAAKLIGVNERTVRLWIEQKKLSASQPSPNRLSIPMSEVDRVIRERQEKEELDQLPTHREMARSLDALKRELEDMRLYGSGAASVDFGDLNRLENRMDALEERLTRIEQALSARETAIASGVAPMGYIPSTPRARRKQQSEESLLPPGAILARHFATLHGVSPATMRDHYVKGLHGERMQVSTRPKAGRDWETEYFLTPEQQSEALTFWERHFVPYQKALETESAASGEAHQENEE